jgi:hypothetical protein
MKNLHSKNVVKASIALCIALLFVIPVSMITTATDTTPPVITIGMVDPAVFVGLLTDAYLYVDATIIDDTYNGVADARFVVTGPGGFSINYTMETWGWGGYDMYYPYYPEDTPLPAYGAYIGHIWAIDTSGNSVVSDSFTFLILQNPIPYVYVDDSAVPPYDGSITHPFPTISIGLAAVAPGGTVFVFNGVYQEIIYPFNANIVGESKTNVIVQAPGGEAVRLYYGVHVNISNITIANSQYGILNEQGSPLSFVTFQNCIIRDNVYGLFINGLDHISIINSDIHNNGVGVGLNYAVPTSNVIIMNCNIYNNGNGILFINNGANTNQIIHNNFINNTQHVAVPYGAGANTWDNGVTGNYWDTYRTLHPNAHIIPSTGTWDEPYTIYSTTNVDHHPWVYPNGYIDTIAPTVVVTYPGGGGTISGLLTITWTASDDLTTNLNGKIGVSYSADAGATWHNIAQHLDNTGSYVWDTNTVSDGTQYLIKVNASDDFQNIGEDASDSVFAILNHPNQAPNTPRQPTGPASGYIGTEYTYTTNTTDPNNDQVYYKWSWGAQESDWMGPYASGATISAAHTWTAVGTYDVKVKAKDASDAESDWSTPLAVTISEVPQNPILTVEQFKGGFGLSAVVKNTGDAAATNVSWSINLDGKMIFLGRNTTGTISSIAPGDSVTIKTGLILGFGKTNIEATATCEEGATYTEEGSAFILLFFVIGVTEPLP